MLYWWWLYSLSSCLCMCMLFVSLLAAMVLCGRSQDSLLSVSMCWVRVVFSTTGFKGGQKPCQKTLEKGAFWKGNHPVSRTWLGSKPILWWTSTWLQALCYCRALSLYLVFIYSSMHFENHYPCFSFIARLIRIMQWYIHYCQYQCVGCVSYSRLLGSLGRGKPCHKTLEAAALWSNNHKASRTKPLVH